MDNVQIKCPNSDTAPTSSNFLTAERYVVNGIGYIRYKCGMWFQR